jgi:hypothetical protein
MNALIAWGLALAALAAAWFSYGAAGLALAGAVIVFWLLLHYGRVLRALRVAGQRPVGRVPSAVMFNARLHAGMTMLQVIGLSRSLGRKQADADDIWAWEDAEGSRVTLEFAPNGKLQRWTLDRPTPAEPAP